MNEWIYKWYFRPRFCIERLCTDTWDNEMGFVMNHAPGAGSIAWPVSKHFSALTHAMDAPSRNIARNESCRLIYFLFRMIYLCNTDHLKPSETCLINDTKYTTGILESIFGSAYNSLKHLASGKIAHILAYYVLEKELLNFIDAAHWLSSETGNVLLTFDPLMVEYCYKEIEARSEYWHISA